MARTDGSLYYTMLCYAMLHYDMLCYIMTYCTILCYASNDNDNDNNNDSTIIVFPYTVYYAILYYTIYCTVLPLLYCTCTVLYYYCITIYCTMLGRTSSPRPSRSTSAGYICYMCYTYICVYVCMYIYIYIYIYRPPGNSRERTYDHFCTYDFPMAISVLQTCVANIHNV